MQVGDLVSCISAGGVLGLITRIVVSAHGSTIYEVLIGSQRYPFRPNMLEVVE